MGGEYQAVRDPRQSRRPGGTALAQASRNAGPEAELGQQFTQEHRIVGGLRMRRDSSINAPAMSLVVLGPNPNIRPNGRPEHQHRR